MTAPDPTRGAATLVELLRARAGLGEGKPAYTFLVDGEREGHALTFAELDRRSRAVGAVIQRETGNAKSGARALLLYPAGLDFVTAFFGTMYGGGVAVPAPVGEPAQLKRTLPRLVAIASDAEPALVLTTREGKGVLEELVRSAPELARLPIVATDALPAGIEDAWVDPQASADDLCFLQYTSGSTSAPKGVMVSHANVLYTAKDIDAGWKYDEHSVLVTWLPIFHDMGLICGIVLPAYKGFHAYVMSPVAFIQKPLRWLAAMSRYKATHSAAPNFAYDLCVRKIAPAEREGLDLSRWAVTLNSAEPVRRETMERFVEAFGRAGFKMSTFCPGFGLAEATVKVTSSNRGEEPVFLNVKAADLEHNRISVVGEDERGPGVISLVGNGRPILETRVAIAHPETRAPLGPLELGEIWVAGPCVAEGYWRRPEETEHTFGARLSTGGAAGDGPYMRTGDLGFVDERGELYCAGRIKDLVIVRGRNFYPQDIERCAEESHAAVRAGCSAAFAADLEGEERLVVCFEVDAERAPDIDAALGAVKQKVAEEFELIPYALVATKPRTIPKTSSGKIQRRAARELFLALGLGAVGVALQREEPRARPAQSFVRGRILAADEAKRQRMVEFYLLSLLAPTLPGADPTRLDLEEPLVHLGLNLPTALDWSDTLRETLGTSLPPVAFFSRLTMKELAASLLAELSRPSAAAPAPEQPEPALASDRGADPAKSARDIEDWLIDRIASQTGRDPGDIEVHRPFSYLGLDSMLAVDLAMDLEDWLGRPLPSTLVWDYPTIEAAARFLAGESSAAEAAAAPLPAEPRSALRHEPIAIIGMACRFPKAPNVDAFWKLLVDKVDAITETPPSRWGEELYDPKAGRPGKLATRWGGFLDDVELFDAAFFGIAAREASRLDPQQRIVLETAYEALEHAGLSPERLSGGMTGVYLGKSSRDYLHIQLAELESIDGYASTGNASSVAAGRVNYVLNLHGPSLAVDTACSSSLVAVHQARRGLLDGECDVALAGGVNLTLMPHWTISFSHAQMMAADGRCKAFDSRADGYVRGEGCAFLVMKRLSDALRDRDDVLAVVRGSAVNHDGASNGLTAPNGQAQQDVIRRALRDGDVAPAEVGYVEAHGTGTPLGDPIEALALAEVIREGRASGEECWIGSVKTNIGHLEPAAGAAGLVKAVLALWKELIPPQLHLVEVNPRIPIASLPLRIATEAIPWPAGGPRRFAGCSSFGFAGTNAHVVLGEAPPVRRSPTPFERPLHLATLSARTPEALAVVADRLAQHLEQPGAGAEPLADVCFTLNTGRAHLAHRAALVVASRAELRQKAAELAGGATPSGFFRGTVGDRRPEKLAFLLPDALGVALEAGSTLAATQPAYAAALERCLALAGGADAFAHLYALAETLAAFGVRPARAAGHGVGRHVALTLGGEVDLAEALQRATTEPGPPAAKAADAATLTAALEAGCDGFVLLGPDEGWSAAYQSLGKDLAAPLVQAGGKDGWPSLLSALAELHVAGFALNFEGFDRGYDRRRVHLPTYPFERKPYWFKSKKK